MFRNFGNAQSTSPHDDIDSKLDPEVDFSLAAKYRALTVQQATSAMVDHTFGGPSDQTFAKKDVSIGSFAQSMVPSSGPPPPPPLPEYYIRHSSFVSSSLLPVLVKSLAEALVSDEQVDFEQVNDHEVFINGHPPFASILIFAKQLRSSETSTALFSFLSFFFSHPAFFISLFLFFPSFSSIVK